IIMIIGELLFLTISYIWYKLSDVTAEKLAAFYQKYKCHIFLGIGILAYICYFTTISFLRYQNFFTGRFDLGNMDQTVWNTLHGRIFELTNPNGTNIMSRLAFHADFILILLAPFYLIWQDPQMLLLIQTVILACGAIFVFLIAKNIIQNKNIALAFSFAYLINPSINHTNLFDFHPVALATTFLLAAWYFLQNKKMLLFLFFLLLAALTKEEAWLIAGFFGVYIFFWKKKRIFGITLTTVSLALFYLLIWKIIPTFLGTQHFALSYYADFGSTPSGIVKGLIFSPLKIISTILQKKQLTYLFELFFPLGFLSLLFPFALLFALPDLAINILSNDGQLHEIYFHYASTITPFLFVSAAYAVVRIKKIFPACINAVFITLIMTTSILSAYFFGPLPGARYANISVFTQSLPIRNEVSQFLSSIPRKYSVAATNNIGSHLSHRQFIYTIPLGVDKADIIVMLLNDPFAQPTLAAQISLANKLDNDKNYIKIFEHEPFVVFKKKNIPTYVKRKSKNILPLFKGTQ
ncbi:MAG: DUF2079 domain-containing protein, partial [Candidatus Levyibacteriota bacterium]